MVPTPMYMAYLLRSPNSFPPGGALNLVVALRQVARPGDAAEQPRARARAAGQRVRVVGEEAEAWVVARRPFEVVDERPGEVALHAREAVAHSAAQGAQVREQVAAAHVVVAVREPILGHVDRQPVAARDAQHAAVATRADLVVELSAGSGSGSGG